MRNCLCYLHPFKCGCGNPFTSMIFRPAKQFAARAFRDFTNTEAKRLSKLPAEAKDAKPPEGPGRDGNKPLMRNHAGDDSTPSPIGHTAGNNLNGASISAASRPGSRKPDGRESGDSGQVLGSVISVKKPTYERNQNRKGRCDSAEGRRRAGVKIPVGGNASRGLLQVRNQRQNRVNNGR
jgi:hypothetical protein